MKKRKALELAVKKLKRKEKSLSHTVSAEETTRILGWGKKRKKRSHYS